MTTANNMLTSVNEIIGKNLDDLGVYYQMFIFCFDEYELHANCFTRIIHKQDILVTTDDYQSWDEKESKHNDMWYNVATYGEVIVGGTVQTVEISPVNDLTIILDNDIRIELFNSNGYHHYNEEREQWFFYKPKDEAYPFISVSSKTIERGDD